MSAFLPSFLFILLAEMGDKTQLLVMAFAMRYPPAKVLLGVFIATFLLNALGVAAGTFLSAVIPMDIVLLAASLSFILFGLWTIRGESHDDEEKKVAGAGAVRTVAAAFFLAEMGDKTQLATVSMTIQYGLPFAVLLGSTAGMVLADSVGIITGTVLGKKIPEQAIRWTSAVVFMLFGLAGVWRIIVPRAGIVSGAGIIVLLAAVSAFTAYRIDRRRPRKKEEIPHPSPE